MREIKMVFITGDFIASIVSSDKAGMQFIKEDGEIDMYLTAMRLGWSQVASSLRVVSRICHRIPYPSSCGIDLQLRKRCS